MAEHRRVLIGLALATGLLLVGAGLYSRLLTDTGQRPEQGAPPHILVIVADDLGWGDVGYHGSEIRTPNIDRLARDGVELDRFYTFPLCSPSRAAFLTGRSPLIYDMAYSVVRPWSTDGLSTDERLLSEDLKAAGYQTALIGKWHLGHTRQDQHPNARGFEHFYGHLNGAVDYFKHEREGGLDWQRNGRSVREEGQYGTELLAREAERLIVSRDRERPLFLYLAFNAPHIPLQVPKRYAEAYRDIPQVQRRIFAGMVTAMDEAIGRVLDTLEREGMAENTLLVFFSDNGADPADGGSNAPLRGGKGTCYEGGIRVPALLHWPGGLDREEKSDLRLHITDLRPTLLAAARAEAVGDAPLNGQDFLPALRESSAYEPTLAVITTENRDERQHAVVLDAGKLLIRINSADGGGANTWAFNVLSDPGETRKLAAVDRARLESMVADVLPTLDRLIGERPEPFATKAPNGWEAPQDWAAALH